MGPPGQAIGPPGRAIGPPGQAIGPPGRTAGPIAQRVYRHKGSTTQAVYHNRSVPAQGVYPIGGVPQQVCTAQGGVAQQGLPHQGCSGLLHRGGTRTGSTAQGVYRHRFYRMVVYQHRGLMYIYIYIYTYTCVYVFAIMFVNLKFGERASQSIIQPTWRPVTVTVWLRQMGGHPA